MALTCDTRDSGAVLLWTAEALLDSEALRVLLTWRNGPLDAARIADEAGFAKRNVNDALAALAAAGVIKAGWHGNTRRFTLGWALFQPLGEISPSGWKSARTPWLS